MASKKMKMETSPLNPMVFHPRFPHIVEKIFDFLDIKSLKNFREVSRPWQEYIDIQNFLWNKIANTLGGNKAFQLACKNGHLKMVNMLMLKSFKFDIEMNAKCGKYIHSRTTLTSLQGAPYVLDCLPCRKD